MAVRPAPWLLILLAACSGAAPEGSGAAPADGKGKAAKMQFAFYHFTDEHVEVSVDGQTVFDRTVTVAPDNIRLGLAAVAQIDLPTCPDIVVKTKGQQITQRLCLTAKIRSIVIDGGPPLTIAAQENFQGAD